jgi:hypothetical protein
MSLSEAFNRGFDVSKQNDAVLRITYDSVRQFYDFLGRVVVTIYDGYNKGGVSTTPFSQVDRETLIAMRDKLVELKGNPPELPPEAPAAATAGKKLNL